MRAGAVVFLLTVVGLLPGVAQAGGERAAEERALALAAASLTEVLPRIAPDARASFAGSNQLAEQIRRGAPFDVFLSASPQYTQALFAEGLVRRPVAFATNDLVVIVPRANPARITNVRDLARRSGLRLVVAGPKVPIGLYTREVLRRLEMLAVLRRAVSMELDVKGIVGKVALGEADAGFVYETDVASVRDRVGVVRIPVAAQPTVRYELAVAAEPVDAGAAEDLAAAVLGLAGRRALRKAGFGVP